MTAAVIIGMHRSGTSTISGIIHLLGFSLGKNVLPPSIDNPRGNFENKAILNFNDSFFRKHHTDWHYTHPLAESWWKRICLDQDVQQLEKIIIDQFDNKVNILIKDPRISVLAPLYLRAFENLDITPQFIIAYRNPQAVISSLRRRNNFAELKSAELWLDHNMKAEYHTRTYPRFFVSYDALIADPIYHTRLLYKWLLPQKDLNGEIEERVIKFIDQKLNHYLPEKQLADDTAPFNIVSSLQKLMEGHQLTDTSKDNHLVWDCLRSDISMYHKQNRKYNLDLFVELRNKKRMQYQKLLFFGSNIVTFRFPAAIRATQLMILISDQPQAYFIKNAIAHSVDDEEFSISWKTKLSGKELTDGKIFLESEKPLLTSDKKNYPALKQIDIDITIMSFRQAAYKMLDKRDLEKMVRHLIVDKHLLLNSFTWKLGNFFMQPIKLVLGILFPGRLSRKLKHYKEEE